LWFFFRCAWCLLQRKIEEKEEMGEGEVRVASQVINYILQTDLPMDLTDEFKSVNNFICKNNTSLYFLIFFHCNSLDIYWWNIFVGVYWWILRGYIQSEKFTAIYRRNNFISIFVYICQISSSEFKSLLFYKNYFFLF
jgi:hypothetical protein